MMSMLLWIWLLAVLQHEENKDLGRRGDGGVSQLFIKKDF